MVESRSDSAAQKSVRLFLCFVSAYFWRSTRLGWSEAHVGASGAAFSWTMAERLLIAGRASVDLRDHARLAVDLCFIYARWTVQIDCLVAVGDRARRRAVPLVCWRRQRRLSGPLVALLCFGGTLLPALGFFNIFPMRYAFVADHYQYLASLGILALVAAWWLRPHVARKMEWRSPSVANIAFDIRRTIAAAVLLGLACLTWQRQSVFHDSWTLWSQTLARNPTSMIANIQMGRLASRRRISWRPKVIFATDCATAPTNSKRTSSRPIWRMPSRPRADLPRLPPSFKSAGPKARLSRGTQRARKRRGPSAQLRRGHRPLSQIAGRPSLPTRSFEPISRKPWRTPGSRRSLSANIGRLVESDPASTAARLGLAVLLARAGSLQKAESECLEILQLGPKHAAATRLLARIRVDRRVARPHGVNDTKG